MSGPPQESDDRRTERLSTWRRSSRRIAAVVLLVLPWLIAGAPCFRGARQGGSQSRAFLFVQINLSLSSEAILALKKEPRHFVDGTVQINNAPPRAVKVRLKGASSFKPIGENPNWTIKAKEPLSVELPRKVYLKNSQQDPSFLRRSLAAFVFKRGSVPTPREGFAWFALNGQSPRLYTLSEGLDDSTLKQLVGSLDGALFEGHGEMGVGTLEPDNKAARSNAWPAQVQSALIRSAAEPASLWNMFDQTNLVRFIAAELLLDDTDGYVFNLNNYRLWVGRHDSKAVLIPCDPEFAFSRGFNVLLKRPVRGRVASLAASHGRLAGETCSELESLCSVVNEYATIAYVRKTGMALVGQVSSRSPLLANSIRVESQKLEAQIPARFAAARQSAAIWRTHLERMRDVQVPMTWFPVKQAQQPEPDEYWNAKTDLVPGRYDIVLNIEVHTQSTNAMSVAFYMDNFQRRISAASKNDPLELRYQFTVERPNPSPIMWAETKQFFVSLQPTNAKILAVKSRLARIR